MEPLRLKTPLLILDEKGFRLANNPVPLSPPSPPPPSSSVKVEEQEEDKDEPRRYLPGKLRPELLNKFGGGVCPVKSSSSLLPRQRVDDEGKAEQDQQSPLQRRALRSWVGRVDRTIQERIEKLDELYGLGPYRGETFET